jgi:hypothetical protein
MRALRILEIAKPVWNSEVTQIRDRRDAEPPKLLKRVIDEGPVVLRRTDVNPVKRRTVAQVLQVHVDHQRKVVAPALVMLCFFEFVDALISALRAGDVGIAILNSSSK